MLTLPWIELLLFMATVGLAALYGLVLSGHFPVEFRAAEFKGGAGTFFMWATVVVAYLPALFALSAAVAALPWYAIVIGGGAMLLAAPLVLQLFSDGFVNGRAGLTVFAAGTATAAAMLWAAA